MHPLENTPALSRLLNVTINHKINEFRHSSCNMQLGGGLKYAIGDMYTSAEYMVRAFSMVIVLSDIKIIQSNYLFRNFDICNTHFSRNVKVFTFSNAYVSLNCF